jgi:hypothetical protein
MDKPKKIVPVEKEISKGIYEDQEEIKIIESDTTRGAQENRSCKRAVYKDEQGHLVKHLPRRFL